MTTTQLFVELLVIGLGALVWLALFLATALGYSESSIDPRLLAPTVLLPLLSFAYVLGILVDRAADWCFNSFDAKDRQRYFGDSPDDYYEARRIMVVHGSVLWAHLEYGRSRLRICRGWALNAVLLWLAFNSFVICHLSISRETAGAIVTYNVLLLLLFAASTYGWRSLNRTEYQKIHRQAPWIQEMKKREISQND
jgi:hypothetical protein